MMKKHKSVLLIVVVVAGVGAAEELIALFAIPQDAYAGLHFLARLHAQLDAAMHYVEDCGNKLPYAAV